MFNINIDGYGARDDTFWITVTVYGQKIEAVWMPITTAHSMGITLMALGLSPKLAVVVSTTIKLAIRCYKDERMLAMRDAIKHVNDAESHGITALPGVPLPNGISRWTELPT